MTEMCFALGGIVAKLMNGISAEISERSIMLLSLRPLD